MTVKKKLKQTNYFNLTQSKINNIDKIFNEVLKNDPTHAQILYLNLISSDFIDNNVSNGLYSPLEVSIALYNTKLSFINDTFKSDFEFLKFYKNGLFN